MSCVVLRLRVEEFLRQRCAESVVVSYQSDATHQITVETLVSLLQGAAYCPKDVERASIFSSDF